MNHFGFGLGLIYYGHVLFWIPENQFAIMKKSLNSNRKAFYCFKQLN